MFIGKPNVVEIDIMRGYIEGPAQAANFTIPANYIRLRSIA
jgi:hypothetical protein